MNTSNENRGAATPQNTRRADKKAVNTKVNPVINFQIGLIAALVAAFLIMELSTAVPKDAVDPAITINLPLEPPYLTVFTVVPNEDPKSGVQKLQQQVETPKVDPNKPPKIVDNNQVDDPAVVTKTIDPISVNPVDSGSTVTGLSNSPLPTPVTPATTHLGALHEIPLFPGCSPSMKKADRVACLNEKMARFIQRKFDTSLGDTVDGKDMVKIDVQFTIGTDGWPKDIKVHASNVALEKEAYKVISRLPKMTPGKIDNMPVNVTYALPIKFKVNN
jgi:protein TonB